MTLESMLQATNFSLINSMQTNNMILNMFIAMFIPILMSFLTSSSGRIRNLLLRVIKRLTHTEYYYRVINVQEIQHSSQILPVNEDDYTYLIRNVLAMYINKIAPDTYKDAEYRLLKFDQFQEESIDEMENHTSIYDLNTSTLVIIPEKNTWVKISENIEFSHEVEKEEPTSGNNDPFTSANYKRSITTKYILRAKNKDHINQFIKQAIEWYKKDVGLKLDKNRYMFMLYYNHNSEDNKIMYNRYTLSESKTFKTLFIPNRERILRTVNDFQNLKGKYGIKGFPKHLNILLTGPPGTGKTSLIKALSEHTSRHVIEIPIGKIKTNQDLYKVIFSQIFNYKDFNGIQETKRYPFSKLIFVIEDIDCVGKIVQKRTEKNQEETKEETKEESREEKSTELLRLLNGKHVLEQALSLKSSKNSMLNNGNDPLTLYGILNVIDGIIECPNRILVFTTNHPEKLDPALTRPGRVNLSIHLDNIRQPEALEMISHYLGTMTEKQKDEFKKLFKCGLKVSPATVEKLCIEHDDVNNIINALNDILQNY